MRYRLHNPLELRDPLGVFYQMCMVFSQSREEFPSTLICSLTFTIPLTLKSASLQHFVGTGVFSDSDSCIGFQFNPLTHKTLISTPECCFFYKTWIWKFCHLQTINICWKNSYFNFDSSLSRKCYSFIPSIHKKTLFFPNVFFCSWKDRKRTEEYYWKLYGNYQIAELETLPTGNGPEL